MDTYVWETTSEINKELAKRLKLIRKRKKMTQTELSLKSNVSYGTIKNFEQTGNISLKSLTKITVALGVVNEIKSLFLDVPYNDISEVINEKK